MANGTIAFDTLQTSGQIDGTARSIDTDYLLNGSAKMWATIEMQNSNALRDSFNVGSTTDVSSGVTTFTFSNNMANTHYSPSGMSNDGYAFHLSASTSDGDTNSRATSSLKCKIRHNNGGEADGTLQAQLHGELA